ncbi:MAG TPA: tRNA (N6-threonylcarbamoyladenosine(37)-N6)-methyltransferase TrmO [Nitrososphaerales archaeon]|nr:tRNA (N6-threonylcarbamoyladenosine(37)-N6)-methyltransferase TrmO [Nitrososphaerales archaeon]
MESFLYRPIGVIHSQLKDPEGAPIQTPAAGHVNGSVEIFPPYVSGLRDIEGFSSLILIYHMHLAADPLLVVTPFLDVKRHGIFSTRAPARPNPIGLSVVTLKRVRGRRLYVQDLDVVEGTPLLDIKPYVPEFDSRLGGRVGWYAARLGRLRQVRADGRFTREPDNGRRPKIRRRG